MNKWLPASYALFPTVQPSNLMMHIENEDFTFSSYEMPFHAVPNIFQNQFIYILMEDVIEDGDWYLQIRKDDVSNRKVYRNMGGEVGFNDSNRNHAFLYKILGSNDPNLLGCPLVSDSFIRDFCRLDGMCHLEVEYTEIMEIKVDALEYRTGQYTPLLDDNFMINVKLS